MQAYSDPKREKDPHALPDVEIFEVTRETPADECPLCCAAGDEVSGPADYGDEHDTDHVGYYWHACFPGCLPDGDPMGPFETQEEALADAQEGASDEEDEEDADDQPDVCATCGEAWPCTVQTGRARYSPFVVAQHVKAS